MVTPKFFFDSKSILSKYAAIDPFPLVPIICIAGIFLQGLPSSWSAFLILSKPNLILSLSFLGDNNSKIFKFALFKIKNFYNSSKIEFSLSKRILISFRDITNGGTILTTFPPAGTTSNPLLKASKVIFFASA